MDSRTARIMNLRQFYCSHQAVALLLAAFCGCALAQQDTADRLWQDTEQQLQQERLRADPEPLEEGAPEPSGEEAAVTELPPVVRLQRLLFSILNAVNGRNWPLAERLLQDYASVPQHDPALFDFVAASRDAAEGRHADAIAGYRKVLETNPGFSRANLDLARTLYADNRLRDARELFLQLRERPFPSNVIEHIDAYLQALKRRERAQISISVSGVYEDNVNRASTVVDPCALVFFGVCLENVPGEEIEAFGASFEGSLNKLWSLPGNHGVMLRGIAYGNHYPEEDDYDNLGATVYLGYQYATARNRFQILPLFEYAGEGGQRIYHAQGARLGFSRTLSARTQLEAMYEYRKRHFAQRLSHLQGDAHSLLLFGNYALRNDLLLYGNLIARDNDARSAIFAYREGTARLGLYKSFAGKATLNLSYAYREKRAEAANAVFGKRQHDREDSVYLNLSVPAYAWRGLTPSLGYEYRNNRSNIAHVYSHEKNRVTLGISKTF
jgi:hypothetical protein